MSYDEGGNVLAISFKVPTAFGERPFRLPVDVDKVLGVLERQYDEGKIKRAFATLPQARRTAWRIAKDWLEAQLAIIESEMVTLPEVLLPYMVVEQGRTLYETMVERRLMLQAGREEGTS